MIAFSSSSHSWGSVLFQDQINQSVWEDTRVRRSLDDSYSVEPSGSGFCNNDSHSYNTSNVAKASQFQLLQGCIGFLYVGHDLSPNTLASWFLLVYHCVSFWISLHLSVCSCSYAYGVTSVSHHQVNFQIHLMHYKSTNFNYLIKTKMCK